MQSLAQTVHPTSTKNDTDAAEEKKGDLSESEQPRPLMSWHDINAANDTNKKIIFKFMRKGFTSLSAEELACTMVSQDFSIDFKRNAREDWTATYQFKVVDRLRRCNFNFQWKTRSSPSTQGLGELGAFFDLCRAGDTGRVVALLRQYRGREGQLLEEVDRTSLKTGLHCAVEENQVQMVQYLVNKGAKVDARDRQLRTPVHLACLKGYSNLVRYLVEQRADPFERDIQGRTCMHFSCCSASSNSFHEVIAILSGASTDLVHMTDHAGRSPLHYAVFNTFSGQIKMIQQLLVLGANINAVDADRRTPLHYAAMEGKSTVIPLLVQNGAGPGLKDYEQQTPADLATSEKIRQQIIVYAPQNQFKPSGEDLQSMAVEGSKKRVTPVANLPDTDYYEPYEHAKPRKMRKINKKRQTADGEADGGAAFTCACACQPA